METTRIVEALLFASEAPLSATELARADDGLDEDAVEAALQALRREYERAGRAFQLVELAGGYQLLTRPEYAPYLERFESVPQSGRLSGAALEVLAVIAYRQPIGRAEVEEIRGVGSAGVLRTLQDRGLIDVVGRSEGLGRPLLYGTTRRFLEHFGFTSIHDLPRPEELPVVLTRRSAGAETEADAEQARISPGVGAVGATASNGRFRPGRGERSTSDGGAPPSGRDARSGTGNGAVRYDGD